jgi:hypothetical protein
MLFLGPSGADRLLVGEGIGPQVRGKVSSQQQRAVKGPPMASTSWMAAEMSVAVSVLRR